MELEGDARPVRCRRSLAGIAFIAIERRAAAPTIDLSLFRRAAFSGANIAILIFNLGTFGVFLYTSLYFQNVLAYSPVKAGTALLPWILVLLLLGPLTGKLADTSEPRHLIAGGLAVMATGLFLLTGIDEHSAYRDLLPGLILGGLGGALTIPLNGVAIGAAPVEKSGVASGIFNTARESGGALGIAVIGAVAAGGSRSAAVGRASLTRSPPATRADSRSRPPSPSSSRRSWSFSTIREPRPTPTAVAYTQTAVPVAEAA